VPGREGINIRAISVADTSDFSTVRFVTDNPVKTANVLRSNGYAVHETDVIAVEVPDHPGALQAVLKPLRDSKTNVLYFYTYLGRGESGQPIVIIGVDTTEEATEALKKELGSYLRRRDLFPLKQGVIASLRFSYHGSIKECSVPSVLMVGTDFKPRVTQRRVSAGSITESISM